MSMLMSLKSFTAGLLIGSLISIIYSKKKQPTNAFHQLAPLEDVATSLIKSGLEATFPHHRKQLWALGASAQVASPNPYKKSNLWSSVGSARDQIGNRVKKGNQGHIGKSLITQKNWTDILKQTSELDLTCSNLPFRYFFNSTTVILAE